MSCVAQFCCAAISDDEFAPAVEAPTAQMQPIGEATADIQKNAKKTAAASIPAARIVTGVFKVVAAASNTL